MTGYGHHVGDIVLAGPRAHRMRALVPKQNALLCRLGGDEFAVICQARTPSSRRSDNITRSIITVMRALGEPYPHRRKRRCSSAIHRRRHRAPGRPGSHHLLKSADLALLPREDQAARHHLPLRAGHGHPRPDSRKIERDCMAGRCGELLPYYQPLIILRPAASPPMRRSRAGLIRPAAWL